VLPQVGSYVGSNKEKLEAAMRDQLQAVSITQPEQGVYVANTAVSA
jgi:hypothetical protein